MKLFRNIKYFVENKYYDIQRYFEVKMCERIYSDYEDNEYNIGQLKHIWGIKSWDDLSGKDSSANLYTMNKIDITYDRKSKLYMLGIETAYMFEKKEDESIYLIELLNAFTKYMDDNKYSKEFDRFLFMSSPSINTSAESIEELYINFKIFVDGYCSVYGKSK